ncbi:MAG: YgaP family membrane protein [Bacillota bacterium]
MEENMGKVDKIIRITIGVIILTWGIVTRSLWGIIGVIPIKVALVGTCPLYSLLGIETTCEQEED